MLWQEGTLNVFESDTFAPKTDPAKNLQNWAWLMLTINPKFL